MSSHPSSLDDTPQPPLADADDPPAWTFLPGADTDVLLLCDHASAAVPRALSRLGLHETDFTRHIAVDLHAAEVTRQLADTLGAPAFLHGYSRLVVDANRDYDDATLCAAVSDGTVVPGNIELHARQRLQRWQQWHQPYHHAISAWLHERMAAGGCPALVSIHSFTPALGGERRRWPIAVLWNEDGRLALPFLQALRHEDGIDAGDNEPYSGRVGFGYTMRVHAEGLGLPHLLIELRQDVIATEEGRTEWVERIARRLLPLLADRRLYRRRMPQAAHDE